MLRQQGRKAGCVITGCAATVGWVQLLGSAWGGGRVCGALLLPQQPFS